MRRLLATAVLLLANGCFHAGYLAQAARGQYEILHRARPLEKVLTDPNTPPRTHRLLSNVGRIKAFGKSQGLKPTRSYERYADLQRPAAVWVVQACAPLSFTSKRWRFPIAGSVPYLGYFDPKAAQRQAQSVAREGLDVTVRTASAYSTLGWFNDPVLSTMLPRGEDALGELANVVLHESVHATFYVKDQSAFDESLASFVADRLTVVWLEGVFGQDGPTTRAWVTAQVQHARRLERLRAAHDELEALYGSSRPREEKLAQKARVLEALAKELKLATVPNNATLAGYRTYQQGTGAFERLLATCDGSWPRFLQTLARLEASDFERPQQENFEPVIDRLRAQGCVARTS